MRYVSVAAVLGWLMVGGAATVRVAAQDVPTNPVPTSEESVGKGRRIYLVACRTCHGGDLKGPKTPPKTGKPAANLVDDKWDHGSSDGEIFNTISKGVPPENIMQAWGGKIEDEDIWNVINFIRDAGKKAAEAAPK